MDGSDLLIKADSPPLVRVYGDLQRLDMPPVSEEDSRELSYALLSPQQVERFEKELELDLSYFIPEIARYRVNIFQQRGAIQSAYRVVPLRVPSMEELN